MIDGVPQKEDFPFLPALLLPHYIRGVITRLRKFDDRCGEFRVCKLISSTYTVYSALR